VKLTSDGLQVQRSPEREVLIMNEDGSGSGEWNTSPFHLKRGSFDYLLHSNRSCVRAARSSNGILGPYVTDGHSLSGGHWDHFNEPSLVKDLDNEEVLFFGYGFPYGFTAYAVHATSIKWENKWPVAVNLSLGREKF